MAEGETWAQYVKRLEVISDYYLISFFFLKSLKTSAGFFLLKSRVKKYSLGSLASRRFLFFCFFT